MWLGLALLSMLCFGLSGFCLKWVVQRRGDSHAFFIALYAIGALVFFVKLCAQASPVSAVMASFAENGLLLAALAVVTLGSALGNQAVAKAYQHGPASLTAPLVNTNVVLVVLMSIVVFGEQLGVLQIAAIAALLIAVSVLGMRSRNQGMRLSKAWWLWVLLAIVFVFSREGGLKIAQSLHANLPFILFCAYAAATVYFIGLYSHRHGFAVVLQHRSSIAAGGIAGVFSALGLMALTTAMMSGPASIVVPIFSMRSVVVIALSVLFFKERLSIWQWLALSTVLLALIAIGVG